MNRKVAFVFLILLSLSFLKARGSHIVGGEVTYSFIADSTGAGGQIYHKYKVNVIIYEDCLNGQPEAIAQDNPAWIDIFDGSGNWIVVDTGDGACCGVPYSSSISVPPNFSNACVTKIPAICLLKKTFTKVYALAANTTGYVVSYQRCCRNAAVANILDAGNTGATYFCTIPASLVTNNSAVFKNYPPQIICLNNPLYYDNSATDADNDSLSYEFCYACQGADQNDIKPPPGPPTEPPPLYYTPVKYFPAPYTDSMPMIGYPQIQIDPVSGLITGTPTQTGRFLVTVCCHEWRDGILINTMKREFQFVVTPCTKVVVADIPQYSSDFNTYIVDCNDYTVNFANTSTGGFTYHWDFGVPGETGDTSDEFEPTFVYPDTGTYSVKLIVNPKSTCPDSITRFVKVYPKFRAAFSDSGVQCPGAPISFTDLSSATIKPITNWKWNFGDGDSTYIENPVHTYSLGGVYNVMLIAQNVKACVDTNFQQLVIDNFYPFAGDDTSIVKGAYVYFNATGGIQYAWSPPTNLSDTSIYNPVGYYPDTGHFTYYVHVVSPYGCTGYDSVKVEVVNQAAFYVPTAFTPNGDGLNDVFRPVAIGYKNLNYFRVFDRWGEEVYFGTSLEVGWDGTYKDQKEEMGTYFWEISFTDRFGNKGFMKGDVTLIR